MLVWGISDWLISRTSKKTNDLQLYLSLQVTGLLVASSAFILSNSSLPSLHDSLIILSAGIIFAFAFIAFIRALAVGTTGLVMPTSSTFPLFTLLLTALFLSITFNGSQIVAMVITVLGVALLAYEKRNKQITLRQQHVATLYALIAAFTWGIGNVIQNIVITRQSWQSMLFMLDIGMTIMGFVFLFASGPKAFGSRLKKSFSHKAALLIGGYYTIGSFGFYYGSVKLGNVIIPLVIASASPLVTSVLGAIYDHEKLSIVKRVGAVIAVGGIIMLNIV